MNHTTQEIIQFQEQAVDAQLGELNQKMAIEAATQAYDQLYKASQVEFNPVEDIEAVDSVIHDLAHKITELKSIDIKARLKEENERIASLEVDGKQVDVNVLSNSVYDTSFLEQELAAEAKIAGAIKTYSDLLFKGLKEKRLLSGQMYGSQGQQGAYIPRMVTMRKAMFASNVPTENLGMNLTIPMNNINPTPHVAIENHSSETAHSVVELESEDQQMDLL